MVFCFQKLFNTLDLIFFLMVLYINLLRQQRQIIIIINKKSQAITLLLLLIIRIKVDHLPDSKMRKNFPSGIAKKIGDNSFLLSSNSDCGWVSSLKNWWNTAQRTCSCTC